MISIIFNAKMTISPSSQVHAVISGNNASSSVKMYCVYQYFYCGMNTTQLSILYSKDASTISRWIQRFQDGHLSEKEIKKVHRKYGREKRQWLVDLYKVKPILYLDEAKHMFDNHFQACISKSSVYLILREAGLTYKVIERRAMQVTAKIVFKYTQELKGFNWLIQHLVFLDEVSFDNREMFRKRGFGLKGSKVFWRGEYCRKP
jgi:transposase